MMDNLAAKKSHTHCQSWADQNGWSATSTQGSLFNPLPSSQHLSLGFSGQEHSYNHLQASSQSCMIDISTLSSTHHPALCKDSLSNSDSSSTSLFANTAVPSSSHGISFVQRRPHTSSVLFSANQGRSIPPPPPPQTNQAPQPRGPRQLPLLSGHNHLKASFQLPLTNQGLPNSPQDLPISLLSCGQQCVGMSQATSEGANVEFAGVSGNARNHSPSTSQEQRHMMPSSHYRGAANMSVPDAVAHPNKESSQEGNTPPANGERRRSVLLHQRAQLLQQLAELDKCLESVPPDDSGEGQPPHTALQCPPSMDDSSQCEQNKTSSTQQVQPSVGKSKSQLLLSVDHSSPVSCEKPNETCDTPDNPEAESEKNENVSDQSEGDNDPDYFPNCHSDFDESDRGDGSSDESSGSSASTPTDRRPSLSGKNVVLEAKSNHPPNQEQPTTHTQEVHMKSSETLVLPCSSSQAQRVYDRRNYCLFCSKPVSKMARHLERIHSDKTEVAVVFQYPKKSRERQKIWNRLINQGNFAHNKDVLKTGKGQLAVRKRPKHTREARDFLHCLYCRGFYTKKALYRHMKLCPEKVKNGNEPHFRRRLIASQCVLEVSDLGVSDGLKSILSKMMYNDVTQAVMDDQVILQFGELLFNQYGSDVRKHEYLRQNLRQIARLVLEAQKITPFKKLEDFFLPSSFPHVVSAVNVLAGYDPETKRYSNPSLAVKIGYHLQKVCTIVEGNAVKCGDASLAESARQFLSVYQKKWNKLISAGALTTLRETKLNKSKKVPFAQDVKRLSLHMESVHHLAEKQLRDSHSKENYVALVRVVLARTVIFNKRRTTEVSSLQLKDFLSRKKSNVHADVGLHLSDLERTMCGFFPRVDIRGKCGRMVPVVLKPSFISAMELFVQVREKCGVPSENPFLFGRPHALSAYNASECIQKYVRGCGAKDPEALTSAKIREHYATMLQIMSLDEDEANQILGPNNQVRALRQNSMQLDDTETDFDDRLEPVRRQQDGSWTHNKHPGTKSVKSDRKGSQKISKHKWEEAEVQAVERHMMRFIQGHKVPQKNDCIQCLEAEPEALRARSWKGVKDYVRNRITSEKNVKKSGAKDLEAQTSTKIRKHYTTLQLMDLDKNDDDQTLGPNNQAQIWQQNGSMQLDDVEMESDERGPEAASWDSNGRHGANCEPGAFFHEQKHGARTHANKTVPQKSVKSSEKAIQNNSKHKWEEAEVQAVERHMMRFIQGHKVPQKNDCIQCLEAEPEALRARSWKGVKDYVRNRITTLKRQGGSSQTTSTNHNWSGQVEEQHFQQSCWTD
uniref:uncharacterized protein LOC124057408 n=1 Tax=Scatophagus argus TaxID=75038 RepID=UPI001ED85BA3|nr:uncharacterized protein LOC124057408 [Scatophagus argus]XP_046241587.1 uncharacterized protein LOC124057408 [Scatophagus argus]XP_046241589.1 uncharacterized protein LOC124057408 [Scatophagus argus]